MAVRRSLKKGDRCPAVAVLQALFTAGHFMHGDRVALDDQFDEDTEEGAMAFQRWAIGRGDVAGLEADGEVADKTLEAMGLYLGVYMQNLPAHFWPQE